jgi:hypothetical protein
VILKYFFVLNDDVVSAMAWHGWPFVFQDRVKNVAPLRQTKTPNNGYRDFLATLRHPTRPHLRTPRCPPPPELELFTGLVFSVSIGRYFLGILPTDTEGKLGRYISVLPLARKWHTPTTHSWPNLVDFFPKKRTPLFADRPPGSSFRPRRVESKGAAGIHGQPITLRFVGYNLFLVGCAGE